MQSAEVQQKIRGFVVGQLLHGEDRGLEPRSPLLEWGVIESLSLLSLVSFLLTEFGVEVPDDELRPDNFAHLDAITQLVLRLTASA